MLKSIRIRLTVMKKNFPFLNHLSKVKLDDVIQFLKSLNEMYFPNREKIFDSNFSIKSYNFSLNLFIMFKAVFFDQKLPSDQLKFLLYTIIQNDNNSAIQTDKFLERYEKYFLIGKSFKYKEHHLAKFYNFFKQRKKIYVTFISFKNALLINDISEEELFDNFT